MGSLVHLAVRVAACGPWQTPEYPIYREYSALIPRAEQMGRDSTQVHSLGLYYTWVKQHKSPDQLSEVINAHAASLCCHLMCWSTPACYPSLCLNLVFICRQLFSRLSLLAASQAPVFSLNTLNCLSCILTMTFSCLPINLNEFNQEIKCNWDAQTGNQLSLAARVAF